MKRGRKYGKQKRRDTERNGNRVTEKYAAREMQGYIDWMFKLERCSVEYLHQWDS